MYLTDKHLESKSLQSFNYEQIVTYRLLNPGKTYKEIEKDLN